MREERAVVEEADKEEEEEKIQRGGRGRGSGTVRSETLSHHGLPLLPSSPVWISSSKMSAHSCSSCLCSSFISLIIYELLLNHTGYGFSVHPH